MVEDPTGVARELGAQLDAPSDALADALRLAHRESIGRYQRDLSEEQLADVLAEAGDLPREPSPPRSPKKAFLALPRTFDPDPDRVEEVALRASEPVLESRGRVCRVLAPR